jgi:hypothetical protein
VLLAGKVRVKSSPILRLPLRVSERRKSTRMSNVYIAMCVTTEASRALWVNQTLVACHYYATTTQRENY